MSRMIDDEEVNRSMGIFIDGVNVAVCEFLGKYNVCKAYVYMPKSCGCDYNPDCYFKQLQRAKAENKKLKEKLHKHISKGYCECKFSKNLQAENEKLKQLKDMYFTFYKAKHDDINGIFFKFKQALEEIRKLSLHCANKDCYSCKYIEKCRDKRKTDKPTFNVCRLITTIINEVLDE